MEALIVQNVYKEDPKQKVTPKRNQAESSLRTGRAPNRRRLINNPQSGASVFRVFTNDKRVLTEIDRARIRARERRRLSLDNSSYPSQIQED